MRRYSAKEISLAAMIAAMYAAITIATIEFSFSNVQVRVAEALTILPVFTPAAIPGLFVGCLVANIVGAASPYDMIFGPLATLAAAVLTRKLRNYTLLAPAPPVIVNAVVVGLVLSFSLELPFIATAASVCAGQLVACYGLGVPLMLMLKRLPRSIISGGQ